MSEKSFIQPIKRWIAILRWLYNGAEMIIYPGFHCGRCGKYWKLPIAVPSFDSLGEWEDTWRVCPDERSCYERMEKKEDI